MQFCSLRFDEPVSKVVQRGEPISSFTPFREHVERNIIIVMVMMITISGMMAMPQACALQASRHAVNSAGLMAWRAKLPS